MFCFGQLGRYFPLLGTFSKLFSLVLYYNSTGSDNMASQNFSDNSDGSDEPEEAAPTRAFARHKVGEALSKAGFGDVHILSHEAADRALTPTRRDIIDALATTEVSSLRELADVLDRDPGNLSRDMKVLVAENLIQYDTSGKSKRPELKHDTIIVEPLVSSEEPLPDSVSSLEPNP